MSFEICINSATVNASALSRLCAKRALASYLYEIEIEGTVLKSNQWEKRKSMESDWNVLCCTWLIIQQKNHPQTMLSSKFYLLCMTF